MYIYAGLMYNADDA